VRIRTLFFEDVVMISCQVDRLRLYIFPHPKSLSLGERDFES
jgi:hypothetical protein